MPTDIPDLRVLQLLLAQDVTLICAGGGGIPVVRRTDGSLIGIEAVFRDFGTEAQSAIRRITLEEATHLDLPDGSMAPKVAAAAALVSGRNRFASVGRLQDALAMLQGRAGTTIAEAD